MLKIIDIKFRQKFKKSHWKKVLMNGCDLIKKYIYYNKADIFWKTGLKFREKRR